MITSILTNIISVLMDAVTTAVAGNGFALPAKGVILSWQTTLDTTPAAIAINLEVSLDNLSWVSISSIDQTDFVDDVALVTLQNVVAAKFIRANVTANGDAAEVTVQLLATNNVG